MQFPALFSPFRIGAVTLRNRIFSTGHDTYLPEGGLPSEALTAYHLARARGGAGLIIVQVVGVHETARYTDAMLMGTDDACIAPFAAMIGAVKAAGAAVFVQLFHPGREILGRPDWALQPAFAPSASPSERFRVAPRALPESLIGEIVAGYGAAARRMAAAGADGVEIVASHGYLPAQFLNPAVNRREDRWGADRLLFLREVIGAVRGAVPAGFVVGLRLSGTEMDADGMDEGAALAACRDLAPSLDYLNVIAGTSASTGGATHIVPSMHVAPGYLAPFAQQVKQATGRPVLVAGRINQPHEAERIIATGAADLCGMTRAMICDPDMPAKAMGGRAADIRACIGCNQACIGHFQLGLPISCIQRPETGRERTYGTLAPAPAPRRVLVVGGGVAGMKAAVTAAARGHRVTLAERARRLGGQALLAQLLPGRAEFGGIVTNLEAELARHPVEVRLGAEVTAAEARGWDAVIVATGSRPAMPAIDAEGAYIVHAADLLAGTARAGARVVVYDWRADWVGAGIAEKLAREGHAVRLAVNGPCAAFAVQNYVRDEMVARLFRLGVETHPFLRLAGADGDTAWFLHTSAQVPVEMTGVDTIVLNWPNAPEDGLALALEGAGLETHLVGDALGARTCEEAVLEGLKAGCAV